MLLNWLRGIWRGAASPEAAPEPVYDDASMKNDLAALDDTVKSAPFIQLGDFLKSYKQHRDAVSFRDSDIQDVIRSSYFSVLTGFMNQMATGRVQFLYPEPGLYNYPERDMFFPEHCYLPASHLVAHAQNLAGRDDRRAAQIFIQALRDAAVEGNLCKAQDLLDNRYLLEDGTRAKANFYSSAYERGSSFGMVLRHKNGTGPRPGL